ncbi:MAG: glycosyltransferase family 2 protein, partial [Anaerolineales bacterium]|nr:glycosyltransferase family 2 protein [Anaerolineales bacterium]
MERLLQALLWGSVGFVLYVYLGYPLLLALLASVWGKKRPFAPTPNAQLPTVTLIIAAYNEEAVIATKLYNTLALDYPADKLQIIVAADGSSDATTRIVQQFARQGVVLSFMPLRQGKVTAINRAVAQATGTVLAFSDANNLYAPDTLRQLVAPFVNSAIGMVSGAKLIMRGDGALGDSEGLYWRYESQIKSWQTRLGTTTGAPGEVMAIRRDLFELVPPTIINDDLYLALRLIKRGFNVHYTPLARSYERVSLTARDEILRRTRMVSGHFQLMSLGWQLLPLRRPHIIWHIVSHKYARPLVPLAMITAFMSNLALLLVNIELFCLVLFAAQLGVYGLAWLGNRGWINGRLAYLPTFLVNSNCAALRGLCQFLCGQPTHQW